MNRIFEKNRHVNKTNEQAETSLNNNAIKFKRQEELPLCNCKNLPLLSSEEMDRDLFHCGVTTEIMEIIRRREKIPETKRFPTVLKLAQKDINIDPSFYLTKRK